MGMETQIIIGALCIVAGIALLIRRPSMQGWNVLGIGINYGIAAVIFFIIGLVWIIRGVVS